MASAAPAALAMVSIFSCGCTKGFRSTVYTDASSGQPSIADQPSYLTHPAAYIPEDSAFTGLPDQAAQLVVLCQDGGQDTVSKVFCVANPPVITGIQDLQAALGLKFADPNGANGANGNPAFVLTGHSSSLVARNISAINPRAILFTPTPPVAGQSFVMLAFARGEEFAEVATTDSVSGDLNFYIIKFSKDCNLTGTCRPADLLTPAVEKNWNKVSIYESTSLNNTSIDCMQCHETKGPGGGRVLRMQEIDAPFTHFFSSQTVGGIALQADFTAAHGTQEDYVGIPAAMLSKSDPQKLAAFIKAAGFGAQDNAFPSAIIEAEVKSSGFSATWAALYDKFVSGLFIAPPYYGVRVSDPAKLSTLTQAYSDFRAGTLPPENLPDLRDVFPDSPQALADMGFQPKLGLKGQALLMNSCNQCHNSVLDQTLSRARFNTDLSLMSRAEKDSAIFRILLPANDPRQMPPPRIRHLSDADKQELMTYLKN